jgi:hypothetical protein
VSMLAAHLLSKIAQAWTPHGRTFRFPSTETAPARHTVPEAAFRAKTTDR